MGKPRSRQATRDLGVLGDLEGPTHLLLNGILAVDAGLSLSRDDYDE